MRAWLLIALAAAVVAVVALAVWFTGRDSSAPGVVSQTAQAGDLSVTMRLDETALGPRVIDVTVNDAAGKPADIGAVRLRFAMTEMDMGNIEVDAQPIGQGRFQARGEFFTMVGNWAVEATLRAVNTPLLVPFTIAIAAPGEASGPLNPLNGDMQAILAGQQLYLNNCVPCHGASGKGDGPAGIGLNPRPGDFTQHMIPGKHTDGQVFLWIKNGFPSTAMPAWDERLSEEQIWQLVTYLRTFGQAAQPADGAGSAGSATAQGLAAARGPGAECAGAAAAAGLHASGQSLAQPRQRQRAASRSPSCRAAPIAEYPSFSPDGKQIAFVAITPPTVTAAEPLSTATLYVMISMTRCHARSGNRPWVLGSRPGRATARRCTSATASGSSGAATISDACSRFTSRYYDRPAARSAGGRARPDDHTRRHAAGLSELRQANAASRYTSPRRTAAASRE